VSVRWETNVFMRGRETEREEKLRDRGGKGRAERNGSMTRPGGREGRGGNLSGSGGGKILRKGEGGEKSEREEGGNA
jgi:hypothetical protein